MGTSHIVKDQMANQISNTDDNIGQICCGFGTIDKTKLNFLS